MDWYPLDNIKPTGLKNNMNSMHSPKSIPRTQLFCTLLERRSWINDYGSSSAVFKIEIPTLFVTSLSTGAAGKNFKSTSGLIKSAVSSTLWLSSSSLKHV